MSFIDPEVSTKLQPELLSGETILWTGRPQPGVTFHSDDWILVPFSLLWGGFAIFWEAGVLGFFGKASRGAPSVFMALWGIPFIVVGQYMIWGRFLFDAWLKRQTYYAVTDRRVVTVQEGWKRRASSAFLEAIPSVSREGSEIGTIWFGPKLPVFGSRGSATRSMSRFSLDETPVFGDIEDVDGVYRLVLDLKNQKAKSPAFSR